MLIFDTWKKIIIFLVSLFAIIFSMPNFISKDHLPNFINAGEIRLGLDLQGGSYLLLEIDNTPVIEQTLQNTSTLIRAYFKEKNIRVGNLKISNENIRYAINNPVKPAPIDKTASTINVIPSGR